MGIFERPDSPFLWLWLERPGRKGLREATTIPKDGGSPDGNREMRRQAQAIYAVRMAEIARGRHKLPGGGERRTFRQHREWYAQHVSAEKRGTDREVSMLRQLAAFFDGRDLRDIDQELAREWRTARMREVSASTVRREEALLKHLLTTAVPKYLDANPLAGLRRVRVVDPDTRVLTHDEERRLLAVLDQEARALVICALDTLLRLRDVADLQRRQDHGTYLHSDTKTGVVKIPISDRLRAALDGLPKGKPVGRFYFPTYAERPNTPLIVMFRRALEEAEIPTGRKTGGVSFHTLRHTGATRMLEAGIDVKTVAEIGGWRNLKVMDRYLHPTDERKRQAVNAVGQRPKAPRRRPKR